jgi:membrane protein required for beta-lactamase induction
MSLIIILLALLLERMAVFIHPIREHHWLEHYSQKITIMVRKNPYLSLPLSIIPVVAIIFLAHEALTRFSFGWASWIFDLIVLLYCLGNTHLRVQIRECYQQLECGNVESARALLLEHFDVVESGDLTPYVLMKGFYRASLQRVFAILFWFVVLGPVGAVLYRMVQKLSIYYVEGMMEKMQTLANRVTFVLDWIPARLLALSFCLAGHFTDIFTEWRKTFRTEIKETYQVLYSCGHIAIRVDAHPDAALVLTQFEEAYYLVCRSLFIWLVVLALIILF